MAKPPLYLSFLLVSSLFAIGGCAPSHYPVSGTVLFEGKPFPEVSVSLIPDVKGVSAVGVTDQDGQFTLETGNTKGVPPGNYTAVFHKFPPPAKATVADERIPGGAAIAKTVQMVPEKYLKPETSDVKVKVPSPDGKYVLEIKTK